MKKNLKKVFSDGTQAQFSAGSKSSKHWARTAGVINFFQFFSIYGPLVTSLMNFEKQIFGLGHSLKNSGNCSQYWDQFRVANRSILIHIQN